jgi:hypothetical protein
MNTKHHKPQAASRPGANKRAGLAALKQTDRAVLYYLDQLRKEDDTCTASLPAIATACDISERQVQISTGRLIKAGYLKRTGYDFGNTVRSRRGTNYRLLIARADVPRSTQAEKLETDIKMLLRRQASIELLLEELTSTLNSLLSMVARLAAHSADDGLQEIQQRIETLKPAQQRVLAHWLSEQLRTKRQRVVKASERKSTTTIRGASLMSSDCHTSSNAARLQKTDSGA